MRVMGAMGCEPHGQMVGAVGAVGGVGIMGAVGCEPHGQVVGGMGDSPRLTYSAIADNPEGGQAGKRW